MQPATGHILCKVHADTNAEEVDDPSHDDTQDSLRVMDGASMHDRPQPLVVTQHLSSADGNDKEDKMNATGMQGSLQPVLAQQVNNTVATDRPSSMDGMQASVQQRMTLQQLWQPRQGPRLPPASRDTRLQSNLGRRGLPAPVQPGLANGQQQSPGTSLQKPADASQELQPMVTGSESAHVALRQQKAGGWEEAISDQSQSAQRLPAVSQLVNHSGVLQQGLGPGQPHDGVPVPLQPALPLAATAEPSSIAQRASTGPCGPIQPQDTVSVPVQSAPALAAPAQPSNTAQGDRTKPHAPMQDKGVASVAVQFPLAESPSKVQRAPGSHRWHVQRPGFSESSPGDMQQELAEVQSEDGVSVSVHSVPEDFVPAEFASTPLQPQRGRHGMKNTGVRSPRGANSSPCIAAAQKPAGAERDNDPEHTPSGVLHLHPSEADQYRSHSLLKQASLSCHVCDSSYVRHAMSALN